MQRLLALCLFWLGSVLMNGIDQNVVFYRKMIKMLWTINLVLSTVCGSQLAVLCNKVWALYVTYRLIVNVPLIEQY